MALRLPLPAAFSPSGTAEVVETHFGDAYVDVADATNRLSRERYLSVDQTQGEVSINWDALTRTNASTAQTLAQASDVIAAILSGGAPKP